MQTLRAHLSGRHCHLVGVSTWLPIARDGCYGFIGPVPSAVLDKLLRVFAEDNCNIQPRAAFVKNHVRKNDVEPEKEALSPGKSMRMNRLNTSCHVF
jgi:hypothetical protein